MIKYYRVTRTLEVRYETILPATSWEEAEAKAESFEFYNTDGSDERWSDSQVEEEYTREQAEYELIELDEEVES